MNMTPVGKLAKNEFHGQPAGSIFHMPDFFTLHTNEQEGHYFEWLINQIPVASIHFTNIGEGIWRSPARGTFAGFNLIPGVSIQELISFCNAIESELKSRGAKFLEILPAPMAHNPIDFSLQYYALTCSGYQVSQMDLNHAIQINSCPLTERMSYGNLKRLRKCIREGLTTEITSINELPEVYETIASNRATKGRVVSMSILDIIAMAQKFQNSITLFSCKDGKNTIAAAICLSVTPEILYVIYWGDKTGYQHLSPVVPIANAIYTYCQVQGFKILDIGTSTIGAEPNIGLINFKRGLAFEESLKIRLKKSLDT